MTASDTNAPSHSLLKFQIGPVQEFIAQARSTRDLWSGSWLLSHLTRKGIEAGAAMGAEILYPVLDSEGDRLAASTPNLFLARVASGSSAAQVADSVEKAIREEWRDIARAVHDLISKNGVPTGWDQHWHAQVDRFPVVDWIVHACVPDSEALECLAKGHPPLPDKAPGYSTSASSIEGLHIAAADWLFAARKNGRGFAAWQGAEIPKDHLDGHREVVGGPEHERFWETLRSKTRFATLLKGRQQYGALNLIKRLFPQAYLGGELSWDPYQPPFDSVAHIAAAIDAEEGEVPPGSPAYYAILALDGDDMGQWVGGCRGCQGDLDPLAPGYHAKLSAKLAEFARKVPGIVATHQGQLVYCGGDDVLAMLPATRALGCARDITAAFSATLPTATASAGIAIGHVRSPLQETIQAAREAEKRAKSVPGKGGFCLRVLKRSGEAVEVAARWSSGVADVWADLADRRENFSRGFAHKLAARLGDLYACWESGHDHGWIPAFTDTLQTATKLETERCLRRQAGLSESEAKALSTKWQDPLMKLSPRHCLHFWTAWAFLLRTDKGEEADSTAAGSDAAIVDVSDAAA